MSYTQEGEKKNEKQTQGQIQDSLVLSVLIVVYIFLTDSNLVSLTLFNLEIVCKYCKILREGPGNLLSEEIFWLHIH